MQSSIIRFWQPLAVPTRTAHPSLPSPEPELIAIGHLSKAHGIRGELVLHTESPDLVGGAVFLRPRAGGEAREYVVARTRRHHGALLASFENVTTRNDAELLRAHTVLVRKEFLPPLEDDEIYLSELPGLRVLVFEHQDDQGPGRELGTITAADEPAGQMLWTITTPDGREILFPAVEEFVLAIDLDKGEAHIAPPPGLLELYLGE